MGNAAKQSEPKTTVDGTKIKSIFRLDEVGELAAKALPAWVRLGHDYLDKKTFYEAVSDPDHHRPLPYTLMDVQMQIERALSGGMEPEAIWEMYAKLSVSEWAAIVNHTILQMQPNGMVEAGGDALNRKRIGAALRAKKHIVYDGTVDGVNKAPRTLCGKHQSELPEGSTVDFNGQYTTPMCSTCLKASDRLQALVAKQMDELGVLEDGPTETEQEGEQQ